MKKLTLAIAAACGLTTAAQADNVLDWNTVLLDSIAAEGVAPPRASRMMGMVQTAVFDAVNSIDRGYQPYLGYINPGGTASIDAAAAQAAHDVLVQLFPSRSAIFATQLNDHLSMIPNGGSKTRGINVGATAATATLNSRVGDGSDLNPPYVPGGNPGDWVPTAPGFANPLLPGWGQVTPFGLQSGSQFRPPAPAALTSAEYTAAYNEVKELGRIDSVTRTAEQTDIARMWAAGGGTVTPPGQWNQIARQVSEAQGLSTVENARLFALLGMAVADAGISAWDTKYEYNFWRPITGIQEGDTDGNDDTIADETWTPLLTTPPFPAYTSGHSTFSAAAAEILASFFGTDAANFSVTSAGVTRFFDSFDEAALEAGQSRIYGGIHWQFDNTAGLWAGENVGAYIFANYLQVPAPGAMGVLAMGGLLASRRRR